MMIINEDFFDDNELDISVNQNEIQNESDIVYDYMFDVSFIFKMYRSLFTYLKDISFSTLMKRMYMCVDSSRMFEQHTAKLLCWVDNNDTEEDITNILMGNDENCLDYIYNKFMKIATKEDDGLIRVGITISVGFNKKDNLTQLKVKKSMYLIFKQLFRMNRYLNVIGHRAKPLCGISIYKNKDKKTLTDDERYHAGPSIKSMNFPQTVYSMCKIIGLGGSATNPQEYRSENYVNSIKKMDYPEYFRKLVTTINNTSDTEMIGYSYHPCELFFKMNTDDILDIVNFVKVDLIPKLSNIDKYIFTEGYRSDYMDMTFYVVFDVKKLKNQHMLHMLNNNGEYIIYSDKKYKTVEGKELEIQYIIEFLDEKFINIVNNTRKELRSQDAMEYYDADKKCGLIE